MIDYVKLAEENAQIEEIRKKYKEDFGMSDRNATMCAFGFVRGIQSLFEKGITAHAGELEKAARKEQDAFIRGFEDANY